MTVTAKLPNNPQGWLEEASNTPHPPREASNSGRGTKYVLASCQAGLPSPGGYVT